MTFSPDQRVTRGPGDEDKKMPQVIALGCARWVWVCLDREAKHRWCGFRHGTEEEAAAHSAALNEGART